MEQIHEQIVDIPGLVIPHFSSFAEEASTLQVVVLLPSFEEFTAPVYNQVHQEQIVAGDMTMHSVENPVVQEQAPQVVGSLPRLEEFTEPVYNQVYQEQIVAKEMTQNMIENSAVQEQVIVPEIPLVFERIQEQTAFTDGPQYELHVDHLELLVDQHRPSSR